MSDAGSTIGKIITDGHRRRDAIHVAVAPVTASCRLHPGEHVGLLGEDDVVGPCGEDNIGIVDPFLRKPVERNERFWLFLYPGTITGLRHVWKHPAFNSGVPEVVK